MSYLAPIPKQLQGVEYVKLYFHLQFQDSFDLPQAAWLQLRREFLQALRSLEEMGSGANIDQLKALLRPQLSLDPAVRRTAQKPPPAFILQPDLRLCGLYQAGERVVLPVLFVGRGVQAVDAFIDLLEKLGQLGIYRGEGRFVLEGVESQDASGVKAMLWSGGRRAALIPPCGDLYWLLDRMPVGDKLLIEWNSPLRLLHDRKPLFRADFSTLFPFIMRRVSAMIVSHSGVELIRDPHRLLDTAGHVVQLENRLQWHDWRKLSGAERSQNLGGLLGSVCLAGPGLGEIVWLLQLGSLLNLGKGSAYGAGQYSVRPL